MSNHTETTEEAIAALRRYADFVQKHSGEITVGHDALREYADRIEAAVKRERAIADVMLAVKDKPLLHPDPDNAPPLFAAPGSPAAIREALEEIDTTESKECYGDHFKCDECSIVNPGWKSACKRQCEYNWEHRNSHTARPRHDDDDGCDIAGQYQTGC